MAFRPVSQLFGNTDGQGHKLSRIDLTELVSAGKFFTANLLRTPIYIADPQLPDDGVALLRSILHDPAS